MKRVVLALIGVGMAAFAFRARAAALESSAATAEADSGGGWLGFDLSGGESVGDAAPGARSFVDMVRQVTEEAGPTMSDADKNTAAFLAMIRASEGTASQDGYRTLFGGKLFESFADHPRVKTAFTQTDGKTNYSTAAGAYQFLASTWDSLRARLGLGDFSPENQDAAALELIREKGALRDVQAGRFQDAVNKLGGVWASLPSSVYPQKTRSWSYVQAAYENAGGSYA